MTKATHLNIKNGEAHKLATELAGLTGESLTSAVTLAFVLAAAMASTVLDTFSAELYGSALSTAGAFGALVLASVVVDRLTRARVELETDSLEFEG